MLFRQTQNHGHSGRRNRPEVVAAALKVVAATGVDHRSRQPPGRRRRLRERESSPASRAKRSSPSSAPRSFSRARSRRRSATATRARTSRSASCSRPSATSALCASCQASRRRSPGRKLDIVIVRENVEDLYAGIEYMQTPGVAQALKIISRDRMREDRRARVRVRGRRRAQARSLRDQSRTS